VNERVRALAANAVSLERVNHINVEHVDARGLRRGSMLDGGIELIRCRVDCSKRGIDGLKQMWLASHHNSCLWRRVCHFGVQVCEMAAERQH
jgi:hypothetical protein